MDRSVIAFIEGIVTIVVFAGIGMTGFLLWSRTRMRQAPELDRLVEGLREENAQLHAELSARMLELEERVDFTERRLLQEHRPAPAPSSKVPTPV